MTPSPHTVFNAVLVEEELRFTCAELQQASQGSEAQLRALVDEGVLAPQGQTPSDWRFHGSALRTTRIALRLGRDLQLSPEGVAMVLDLLAELERLQARLRRAGLA